MVFVLVYLLTQILVTAHTPLQIQAQQPIIPVDQLANITGNQNATVDMENVSAPALQNEIEQNDVSAQASADIEQKDELPVMQSEQNNINDNHTSK